ncbi:cryptochrome/photolyase family protein [Dyella acidiphila]|uniref:Deoxyribodipyrimidine photo-lyase n=1 Tax=Dyella acidiphila TaxID=2775866 RepID=A0ABR9GAG0_9GAMM|nr:deoxyribodipyrimidine photo-lyase [Dyella acidiphila]MBE1161024.1 deoxyribodipyrimidine photo-lyase [Dyella acidiphila]
MSHAIVWFRRDLRLADNAALHHASAAHHGIVPLYIHAPQEEGEWTPGAASRWWLHHSLQALDKSLRRHHGALQIRQGESLPVLLDVLQQSGADTVYWNRLYEPAAIARDTQIKAALRERGITVHSCGGALWQEPWQLATQEGQPYRVFTPYWRKLRTLVEAAPPLATPALSLLPAAGSVALDTLQLLPRIAWDAGMREAWTPGEQGAEAMLDLFADDALGDYAAARDLPARHGTSRLSPHLHFGEITPGQIHHGLVERLRRRDAKRRPDLEPYLRELGWREFAHYLLYHFPKTPADNFNPRFDGFKWSKDSDAWLQRWQQGRTGIPLVDAGMRELWHTGWMHNRVRMIVASFLTKNLRQHWLHGARWFWDTLVDADLANNTLGWQWVAGCGADAAPYFRVFNPVTQAQKFDPKGVYLRRWLPELSKAPDALLHEPWKDESLLKRSAYPAPMIDLGQSRQAALAAYQAMRR